MTMDESKRSFLKRSVGLLGAAGFVASGGKKAAAEPPEVPQSMKVPGAGMGEYGTPAKYESKVTRTLIRSQPGTTGSGASRTPLEALDGMITPSGLHFERHHNGVPDIDPDTHRLLIHGMVKRPLIFSVHALMRYPMISRIHFLECSGNSQFLCGHRVSPQPQRDHRRGRRDEFTDAAEGEDAEPDQLHHHVSVAGEVEGIGGPSPRVVP
jgi:sulfane dehydrogenase subunit SoxC